MNRPDYNKIYRLLLPQIERIRELRRISLESSVLDVQAVEALELPQRALDGKDILYPGAGRVFFTYEPGDGQFVLKGNFFPGDQ